MKANWKKYLLYGGIIIFGGTLLFILVQTVRAKNTGFEVKTLWDWMELLIVPSFLTGGAIFLNRSEKEIEGQRAEARAKLEREIAADRHQESALQSYIDKMSELLLERDLLTTDNEEVRNLAKTRTVSVIRVLGSKRINIVMGFLREAKLLDETYSILKDAKLEHAELQGVMFSFMNLRDADLSSANLDGASFGLVDLRGVKFEKATLRGAKFSMPNLIGLNFQEANLEGADLRYGNLSRANLAGANLSRAKLVGTDLSGADLSGANLKAADVTIEQLMKASSLKDAIMPDGTKYK